VIENVLLVGGSGFVGSHVARRLTARGLRVTVPTRRRERAKHQTLLPTVDVIETDVHDDAVLARLCAGHDAVASFVGILKGGKGKPYGTGFVRAHVELPGRLAHAAATAGIEHFVHISALKAAADAPSGYLRSKAAGEAAVRTALPDATILRPSVIFGAGDSFLIMFAGLLKFAPVVPLASPDALFQPVWIGNVADAVVEALLRPANGQTFELCGPQRYTLRQLVEYTGVVTGRRRPVIGLSPGLSWLQAFAMEIVGGPMTRDNYDSMSVPNVCSEDCALPYGLAPVALEDVAPGYLGRPSR
jgi:NADH dehydrogenase